MNLNRKLKNNLETNDNENTNTKNMWYNKSSFKRYIHSDIDLALKKNKDWKINKFFDKGKISSKQPNLAPKISRKRKINKTYGQQKGGSNKGQRRILLKFRLKNRKKNQ